SRSDGIRLDYEWNVSEEIDAMPVRQRTKEPRFRTICRHLRFQSISCSARSKLLVGGLTKELVDHRDLEEDSIVHRLQELVRGSPDLRVELLHARIVPGDNRLICRQLFHLPQESNVLGESFVDSLNVRLARRSLLTGHCEARIDLRQESA